MMTRQPIVFLLALSLILPVRAFAVTVTGVVQPHMFEQDSATGVRPLGSSMLIQRSVRHRTLVEADPRLIQGATMRVRGTRTTTGLLVPRADARGVTLMKPIVRTPAFAVEHLLVVPITFLDMPLQANQFQIAARYPRLENWIARSSYGHTRLVTTVLDPVVASVPFASVVCNFSGMIALAVRLADPLIDFRTMTLLNVVIPAVDWETTHCPPGAAGAGGAYVGRYAIGTAEGNVMLGQQITNEDWTASVHETGHSLGLIHANSLDCDIETFPASLDQCTGREYGDPFDYMGTAAGDWSALRKTQLGWLGDAEYTLPVHEPGTWTLDALELPALPGQISLKGLRLPVGSQTVMLEARFNVLNDTPYPFSWFEGIQARIQLTGHTIGDGPTVPADASHYLWPHPPSARKDEATLFVGEALDIGPWRVTALSHDDVTQTAVVKIDSSIPSPTPRSTPPGPNCCEYPPYHWSCPCAAPTPWCLDYCI